MSNSSIVPAESTNVDYTNSLDPLKGVNRLSSQSNIKNKLNDIRVSNSNKQQSTEQFNFSPIGSADASGYFSYNDMVSKETGFQDKYYTDFNTPTHRWDDEVSNSYEIENMQDFVADKQSGIEVVANGLAKAGVTATTTFINGVVGTLYGLGSLAVDANISAYSSALGLINEDLGNAIKPEGYEGFQFNKLWNNHVTQALNDVNKASNELFTNYQTTVQQEAPWWQNLGTATFWADNIIANAGFTVGAIASGMLTGNALSAVGFGATATKWGSTALATMGEAGVEAINAADRFVESNTYLLEEKEQQDKNNISSYIEKRYNEIMSMPDSPIIIPGTGENGLQGAGITSTRAEALKELQLERESLMQQSQLEKADLLKKIQEEALTSGNVTFAANSAILGVSNNLQFSHLFEGGYKNAVKGAGKLKYKQSVADVAEDVVEKSSNPLGFVKPGAKETAKQAMAGNVEAVAKKGFGKAVAKKAFTNSLAESGEEFFQSVASEASYQYAGQKLNTFAGYKFNNEITEDNVNMAYAFTDALASQGGDASSEAWMGAFAGLITGGLGVPFAKKKNGKLGLTWHGGVKEAYDEVQKDYETNKYVDEINQRFTASTNPNQSKTGKLINDLVRSQSIKEEVKAAAENKDENAYDDASMKQLIADAILFKKAGFENMFLNMLESSGNISKEDVNILMTMPSSQGVQDAKSTKAETPLAFEGMTEEQVSAQVKENASALRKKMKKFSDSYDYHSIKYNDLGNDVVEELSYYDAMNSFHIDKTADVYSKVADTLSSMINDESSVIHKILNNNNFDATETAALLSKAKNAPSTLTKQEQATYSKLINATRAAGSQTKKYNVDRLLSEYERVQTVLADAKSKNLDTSKIEKSLAMIGKKVIEAQAVQTIAVNKVNDIKNIDELGSLITAINFSAKKQKEYSDAYAKLTQNPEALSEEIKKDIHIQNKASERKEATSAHTALHNAKDYSDFENKFITLKNNKKVSDSLVLLKEIDDSAQTEEQRVHIKTMAKRVVAEKAMKETVANSLGGDKDAVQYFTDLLGAMHRENIELFDQDNTGNVTITKEAVDELAMNIEPENMEEFISYLENNIQSQISDITYTPFVTALNNTNNKVEDIIEVDTQKFSSIKIKFDFSKELDDVVAILHSIENQVDENPETKDLSKEDKEEIIDTAFSRYTSRVFSEQNENREEDSTSTEEIKNDIISKPYEATSQANNGLTELATYFEVDALIQDGKLIRNTNPSTSNSETQEVLEHFSAYQFIESGLLSKNPNTKVSLVRKDNGQFNSYNQEVFYLVIKANKSFKGNTIDINGTAYQVIGATTNGFNIKVDSSKLNFEVDKSNHFKMITNDEYQYSLDMIHSGRMALDYQDDGSIATSPLVDFTDSNDNILSYIDGYGKVVHEGGSNISVAHAPDSLKPGSSYILVKGPNGLYYPARVINNNLVAEDLNKLFEDGKLSDLNSAIDTLSDINNSKENRIKAENTIRKYLYFNNVSAYDKETKQLSKGLQLTNPTLSIFKTSTGANVIKFSSHTKLLNGTHEYLDGAGLTLGDNPSENREKLLSFLFINADIKWNISKSLLNDKKAIKQVIDAKVLLTNLKSEITNGAENKGVYRRYNASFTVKPYAGSANKLNTGYSFKRVDGKIRRYIKLSSKKELITWTSDDVLTGFEFLVDKLSHRILRRQFINNDNKYYITGSNNIYHMVSFEDNEYLVEYDKSGGILDVKKMTASDKEIALNKLNKFSNTKLTNDNVDAIPEIAPEIKPVEVSDKTTNVKSQDIVNEFTTKINRESLTDSFVEFAEDNNIEDFQIEGLVDSLSDINDVTDGMYAIITDANKSFETKIIQLTELLKAPKFQSSGVKLSSSTLEAFDLFENTNPGFKESVVIDYIASLDESKRPQGLDLNSEEGIGYVKSNENEILNFYSNKQKSRPVISDFQTYITLKEYWEENYKDLYEMPSDESEFNETLESLKKVWGDEAVYVIGPKSLNDLMNPNFKVYVQIAKPIYIGEFNESISESMLRSEIAIVLHEIFPDVELDFTPTIIVDSEMKRGAYSNGANILINFINSNSNTIPHEYAHHIFRHFRSHPILNKIFNELSKEVSTENPELSKEEIAYQAEELYADRLGDEIVKIVEEVLLRNIKYKTAKGKESIDAKKRKSFIEEYNIALEKSNNKYIKSWTGINSFIKSVFRKNSKVSEIIPKYTSSTGTPNNELNQLFSELAKEVLDKKFIIKDKDKVESYEFKYQSESSGALNKAIINSIMNNKFDRNNLDMIDLDSILRDNNISVTDKNKLIEKLCKL